MSASKKIVIQLPDFFKSWLAEEPRVNPHYEVCKPASEQWMVNFCGLGPKMASKIERCDFSYFAGIFAPRAPLDKFKTACDWGSWAFPYDDMFDNGSAKDDPVLARSIMQSCMDGMTGVTDGKPKLAVVRAHDNIFARLAKGSNEAVAGRYREAMDLYHQGALLHVEHQNDGTIPTLEEMVITRRMSSAVRPLQVMVEYAHGLNIPAYVFDNPAIQELQVLGVDLISISNDIISYMQEEAEGVPHNLVAAGRLNGHSAQEAVDLAAELLEQRYVRWDEVVARVPSWGEDVDAEVAQYIEGIQNVDRGNLYWSFRSERYFGKRAREVRLTRQVEVMNDDDFWAHVGKGYQRRQ